MIYTKVGTFTELKDYAYPVRCEVFVIEQQIPLEIEHDIYDQAAIHAVVFDDKMPISTARLVEKVGEPYSIGRVATLKEHRGKGYGRLVTLALVKWAKNNNISEIHLHAQKHAENFYKKIGFATYGNEFFDAGSSIPHVSMVIKLES